MSPGFRYGVLGTVTVWEDGSPSPLRSRQHRRLLATLLAAGDAAVPADVLIEAAWSQTPPTDPRAALHTALSRLRRILPERTPVEHTPAGYLLTVPVADIDAGQFERLFAAAAEQPDTHAIDLLRSALALWRGPAYGDVADLVTVAPEAARLDEHRRRAAEELGRRLLATGQAEQALDVAATIVAEDPIRESTVALRMHALYQLGRPTEALDEYRQLRSRLSDELGLDPSPALRNLEHAVLNHTVTVARPSPDDGDAGLAVAWRPSTTTYVGRDADHDRLVRATGSHRLVTITGPGGVGKTRLVAEAAADLQGRLARSAMLVELASTTSDDVDLTIATALGLRPTTADLRRGIVEYLASERRLLLLDNCEHVRAAVRPLVADILRHCPHVAIVATSRVRLGLPHEQVLPLGPLTEPDTGGDRAALDLVVDRARHVSPGFAIVGDDRGLVVAICRRLGGLPLALELAATRIAMLGVRAVHDRLDDSLDLLADPDDDSRSLRGVLEWSYRLLDAEAAGLLEDLSVFEEAADLAAIEAVSGRERVAAPLAILVDASLVGVDQRSGDTRYRLLELVRRFASEKLTDQGRDALLRRRHAAWVRRLVRRSADDATGPADREAADHLAAARADVRTALRWSLDDDPDTAAAIAGHLGRQVFFRPDIDLVTWTRLIGTDERVATVTHGPLATAAAARAAAAAGDLETGDALAARVADVDDDLVQYLALHARGIASLYRGDGVAAVAAASAGHELAGLPPAYRTDFHVTAALAALYGGDRDTALGEAAAASATAEASGALAYRAIAAYVEGECVMGSDLRAAVARYRQAIEWSSAGRAPFVVGLARTSLASALVRLGDHEEAASLLATVIRHWRQVQAWPQVWTTLRLAAELLDATGDHAEALLLVDAAAGGEGATAVQGEDAARLARIRTRALARLDEATRRRVFALAAALAPSQVVERAGTALRRVAEAPALDV